MIRTHDIMIAKNEYISNLIFDTEFDISQILGRKVRLEITEKHTDLSPVHVFEIVSRELNLTINEIKGQSKSNRIVEARTIICQILKDKFQLNRKELRIALRRKTGTRITETLKRHQRWMKVDLNYVKKYKNCCEKINSLTL